MNQLVKQFDQMREMMKIDGFGQMPTPEQMSGQLGGGQRR